MHIEIFSLKTYIKHLKFPPVFLIQFSSSSNIIMQNWRYFSREYLEINESRDPPSKYEIDQFNTKKFILKRYFWVMIVIIKVGKSQCLFVLWMFSYLFCKRKGHVLDSFRWDLYYPNLGLTYWFWPPYSFEYRNQQQCVFFFYRKWELWWTEIIKLLRIFCIF